MNISYKGVGDQVITLLVDSTSSPAVKEGTVVALSANNTVKTCPASGIPAGIVLGVQEGVAAVQVAGYMRFSCDSGMAVGYAQLALDSTGVLAAGTGRGGLVVDVDTENNTCGVIFA